MSPPIYGACGPPIIGALQAVADAGSSALVRRLRRRAWTSWRRSPPATELGSVAQFPHPYGIDGCPSGARRRSTGAAVETDIDTGTAMVTAENVAEFMAPAGSVPATTS